MLRWRGFALTLLVACWIIFITTAPGRISTPNVTHRSGASEMTTAVLNRTFYTVSSPTPLLQQVEAVRRLCDRLMGAKCHTVLAFEAAHTLSDTDSDFFEIVPAETDARSGVVVRGSSGVAMASGLHWYSKRYFHCDVSWHNQRCEVPATIPQLTSAIRIVSPFRFGYYLNAVTFSYSLVWWDWARWEQEIDWMALMGTTMPLAFTGQESVWRAVFLKFGLDDDQISEYFTGPAYLAWMRMGNIHSWDGPLPSAWIQQQHDLQLKILQRCRSFGMLPVLPAFAGHVPQSLFELYPNAEHVITPDWFGFKGGPMLSPTDPLFFSISKAIIEETRRQYGSDHVYAADSFNEMRPAASTVEYLTASSRAVFEGMVAGDENALWVMQGWLFVHDSYFWHSDNIQALLAGVPHGRLLLLDLYAESSPVWKTTSGFYSTPWSWSYLGNFGGVTGMHGDLGSLVRAVREVGELQQGTQQQQQQLGSLLGFGVASEGIVHNPILYALIFELRWSPILPSTLEHWVQTYVRRRYANKPSLAAARSWNLLLKTVYACSLGPMQLSSVVAMRPSLTALRYNACLDPKRRDYHQSVLLAWKHMWEARADVGGGTNYEYDLIDVSREGLSVVILRSFSDVLSAHATCVQSGDGWNAVAKSISDMLTALDALDKVLNSHTAFMLGPWIAAARAHGSTAEEADRLESSARRQITLWGGADSVLHDYAHKIWGGLVGSFYLPGWRRFFSAVEHSTHVGQTNACTAPQPSFSHRAASDLAAWAEEWVVSLSGGPFPTRNTTDPVSAVAAARGAVADVLVALETIS